MAWDDAEPLPSYALVEGETGQQPTWHAAARLAPADGGAADTTARHRGESDPGGWTIHAGQLMITLDPTGQLTFVEPSQSPAMSSGIARDSPSDTVQVDRAGAPGAAVRVDSPPHWDGAGWSHRSMLAPDALVLGLGGRAASLNRRPGAYQLWNTDPGGTYGRGDDPLSMNIPVYLVVAGPGCHLAFYDNSFAGAVEVDRDVRVRLGGGPLRYYVFPGPPARALDGYTRLTGRPALPPRWALGFHQSRWGYGSQAAMEEMVAEFRRRELPLSGVWLDIDHLDRRRVFTVDTVRYPDLGRFATDLAKDDIHLVAIVDPAIPRRPDLPLYADAVAEDVLCRDARGREAWGVVWPGATAYPDFTAARTREWWGRRHVPYLDIGIDGFWNDMNEPSAFAAFGEPTLARSTRADLDGRGGDHREAHNLYGLLMDRATYEGVRRERPDKRPYVLTRAGWAGVQRYGGTWSGDIGSRWDNLAVSLAFTLGLGACGVPYSGPDIGGFDDHPPTELFVRWFELASYLPFFRSHCAKSAPPREPWAFGPQVLECLSRVLAERYALLPYWYTLAWEAHRTGMPYVRPLAWEDPGDPLLRDVDDAFLLGESLLVAPILTEGARERVVRLPRGRWYERRSGTLFDGGGEEFVHAPLGKTPVFVRAGAVLPIEERRGDGSTQIVLEAHPPAPGETGGGRLVTDAGDGWAEPVDERFVTSLDTSGAPVLDYDGPATRLPYPVRWAPQH